jgi:glycine cleavage system H protein
VNEQHQGINISQEVEDMAEPAPKNGEFFDGKLWFQRRGSVLTLGLTSNAVEELGSVESLELPNEGDDFDRGDVVVTVEGSQGKVEVITPAAGLVTEVNEGAQQEPDRVTEDPLEEGWLVKLQMQDLSDLNEYAVQD